MLDIFRVLASKPKEHEPEPFAELYTPWGARLADDESETPLPLHPHPQFEREQFACLNGWWDYAFVDCGDINAAERSWRGAEIPDSFEGQIRVPFSPEAPLSGVERQLQPYELLWYRRVFAVQDVQPGTRRILHFEAVDYACSVWCNGTPLGWHEGGNLPFSFDVTDVVYEGLNELAVCVFDPSEQGTQLRGKQQLERRDIWYTAQSGIWQSVWMETVPTYHVKSLALTPVIAGEIAGRRAEARLDVSACVSGGYGIFEVQVTDSDGRTVATGSTQAAYDPGAVGSDLRCNLSLDIAAADLWYPDRPTLYGVRVSYGDDTVYSYCAFRTIETRPDRGAMRLFLNGEPLFLRAVLDQGRWPEGLLTPPADEALAFDIETAHGLGFNAIRKHLKVECDRWYYHCDRLGMLVLQDMVSGGGEYDPMYVSYRPTLWKPSWYSFDDSTPDGMAKLSAGDEHYREEWLATCVGTVNYLRNHPCIIAWVLFNEGWGQFEAAKATALVRSLDPSRLIDSTSGWYDQRCGDFHSVHNYFRDLEVWDDPLESQTGSCVRRSRAFLISEFGGLSYLCPGHSVLERAYGYDSYDDGKAFASAVRDLLSQVDALEADGLVGYVYTQLADVEEEVNGLVSYDRRIVKI